MTLQRKSYLIFFRPWLIAFMLYKPKTKLSFFFLRFWFGVKYFLINRIVWMSFATLDLDCNRSCSISTQSGIIIGCFHTRILFGVFFDWFSFRLICKVGRHFGRRVFLNVIVCLKMQNHFLRPITWTFFFDRTKACQLTSVVNQSFEFEIKNFC